MYRARNPAGYRRRNGRVNPAPTPRTMPSRGAKTAAIANLNAVNKAENAEQSEEEAEEKSNEIVVDAEADECVVEEESIPVKPTVVFATFSTNTELEQGLCVVRPLGGGEYEIVNLQKITAHDVTTPQMNEIFSSDEKKLAMFDVDEKSWKEAAFVCNQAVLGAGAKLFHFLKLPIEIRYTIYELTFLSNKSLKFVSSQPTNAALAPTFLQTCRAVQDEGSKFWHKNTFLLDWRTFHVRSPPPFVENIRNLHIILDGSYKTDVKLLAMLQHCEHLESLTVEYGMRLLGMWLGRTKAQTTHLEDPAVLKFRRFNSHDILCALRGLKRITLLSVDGFTATMPRQITLKDLKGYQGYLSKLVTLPKPTPEEVEAKKAELENLLKEKEALRAAKEAKRRRRHTVIRSKAKFVGDDEEYDGRWD